MTGMIPGVGVVVVVVVVGSGGGGGIMAAKLRGVKDLGRSIR